MSLADKLREDAEYLGCNYDDIGDRMRDAAAKFDGMQAALQQVIKFSQECSDPEGWLAVNVRHAAKAALG